MIIKPRVIKAVDLFAGAGGFGLGFHLANYDLLCAVERDKWAVETLKHNGHCRSVVEADIQRLQTREQIWEICSPDPDIVIGGPPCQGFSIAGPAEKKDPKDPRNSLFEDFARWIFHLQPRMFVMENVKGILTRKNVEGERVIDIINATFRALKYDVEVWVLNAAEFGVPQTRERVFIVGHRLGRVIGPPPKTHCLIKRNGTFSLPLADQFSQFVTTGDAILDLPPLKAGEGSEEQEYTLPPQTSFQEWARHESPKLYNHVAMNHTQRIVERFRRIQKGNSLAEVPMEYRVRMRSGNGELSSAHYQSNYRQLRSDDVSYTIPASFYSSFIHPNQPRNITAREAARLQSFPDWYRFMGKRTVVSSRLLQTNGRHEEDFLSQYNQIGNAVPPLLAKAIADHLKQHLGD